MLRIFCKWVAMLMAAMLAGAAGAAELFSEDFSDDSGNAILGAMQAVDVSSNKSWGPESFEGATFAAMNGFEADTASEDWLVTPEVDLGGLSAATLRFTTMKNFEGPPLEVLVAPDYSGAGTPEAIQAASWQALSGYALSPGDYTETDSGPVDLSEYIGDTVHIAFKYTSTGTAAGDAAKWELSRVQVTDQAPVLEARLEVGYAADFDNALVGETLEFTGSATNAKLPISYEWSFGDGVSATGRRVEHGYQAPGSYDVSVTVIDDDDDQATATHTVEVKAANPVGVPDKQGNVRVATFNTLLFGESEGAMLEHLQNPDFEQAQKIAEIIQRVRPDVLLLNEVDYEPGLAAADALRNNFLQVSQNGAQPIVYDYAYVAPSNTGVPTGFDLNNDGSVGGGDDAQGFGTFEGQYGMMLLSRLPIDEAGIRTFRKFLWKDMPDARLPADPEDADNNGDTSSWYTQDELEVLRLSSKSHWDVPVVVNGRKLHILASHPTPPVFDGAEDRNGKRNADEIRFWADYVTPGQGDYIVDDSGQAGALKPGAAFVIAGDLNADPDEADSLDGAVQQILQAEPVNGSVTPTSAGGAEFYEADDTLAPWRLDYVQPSVEALTVEQSGVFWPASDNPLRRLVGKDAEVSSDHRMVWVDLSVKAGTEDGSNTDSDPGGDVIDIGGEDGGGNDGTDSEDDGIGPAGALVLGLLLVGAARRRR